MEQAPVIVSKGEGIGRITLNRPEKRNALNDSMLSRILDVLDEFERAEDVRVLLVAGNGSVFCSGMDLAEMRSIRETVGSYDYDLLPKVFERLGSYRKPTVAMVHGAAIAGGCELALHCDLRIGSPAAKFAMPLARLGLVIPTEPAERLVNIVGFARARDLLLTGDAVDGEQAERIGLLSRLVDATHLAEKTEELVRRLAANAPLSLLAMKQLLDRLGHFLTPQERDAFENERLRIGGSEDMREGLRAFFERRTPVFRGV
jgi:enoyl-CoA hydratase